MTEVPARTRTPGERSALDLLLTDAVMRGLGWGGGVDIDRLTASVRNDVRLTVEAIRNLLLTERGWEALEDEWAASGSRAGSEGGTCEAP